MEMSKPGGAFGWCFVSGLVNGRLVEYRFKGVPMIAYERFEAAEDKAKFFYENILGWYEGGVVFAHREGKPWLNWWHPSWEIERALMGEEYGYGASFVFDLMRTEYGMRGKFGGEVVDDKV